MLLKHAHTAQYGRTERESLEEGAVDELPVGLREMKLYQCLLSIVFHNKVQKARIAVTTLIYLFSTNVGVPEWVIGLRQVC